MQNEFYERRMDTPNEMLASVLDAAAAAAAARIKKREDQLRRTTRELRTGFAEWFEVDSGILRTFIFN